MIPDSRAALDAADNSDGKVDEVDALVVLSYYDAVESFLMTPFRVGSPIRVAATAVRAPRQAWVACCAT